MLQGVDFHRILLLDGVVVGDDAQVAGAERGNPAITVWNVVHADGALLVRLRASDPADPRAPGTLTP
ncbi:hypothetical protein ACWD1Y_34485 [Streptomyces sp. NPDC002814]